MKKKKRSDKTSSGFDKFVVEGVSYTDKELLDFLGKVIKEVDENGTIYFKIRIDKISTADFCRICLIVRYLIGNKSNYNIGIEVTIDEMWEMGDHQHKRKSISSRSTEMALKEGLIERTTTNTFRVKSERAAHKIIKKLKESLKDQLK